MEPLTVCIPKQSMASSLLKLEEPSTPTACDCMSCATGLPGNRRSYGNSRCLTNTYAVDKLIALGEPLFNKEQLGKYAEQSPFLKKVPTQEKQADCDCISCFIGEKCLIWGYKQGELSFTKEQLGQYYKYTPLYEENEHNLALQTKYKSMF